jgi:hypothetical protein
MITGRGRPVSFISHPSNVSSMKTLVVFYSRTRFCAKVAVQLSSLMGADVDEVADLKDRSGPIGFVTGGRDAMSGAATEIRFGKDPSGYDLVVVGGPIWAWTVSPAIRTYLAQNRGRFKALGFFCTMGGSGDKGGFEAMEKEAGMRPKATLALKAAEVANAAARIGDFAKALAA